MSRGDLTVIGVRAQALEDQLRQAVTMHELGAMFGGGPRRAGFYLNGPDLSWAAQRLRSACEKALGTRGRHYDRGEP